MESCFKFCILILLSHKCLALQCENGIAPEVINQQTQRITQTCNFFQVSIPLLFAVESNTRGCVRNSGSYTAETQYNLNPQPFPYNCHFTTQPFCSSSCQTTSAQTEVQCASLFAPTTVFRCKFSLAIQKCGQILWSTWTSYSSCSSNRLVSTRTRHCKLCSDEIPSKFCPGGESKTRETKSCPKMTTASSSTFLFTTTMSTKQITKPKTISLNSDSGSKTTTVNTFKTKSRAASTSRSTTIISSTSESKSTTFSTSKTKTTAPNHSESKITTASISKGYATSISRFFIVNATTSTSGQQPKTLSSEKPTTIITSIATSIASLSSHINEFTSTKTSAFAIATQQTPTTIVEGTTSPVATSNTIPISSGEDGSLSAAGVIFIVLGALLILLLSIFCAILLYRHKHRQDRVGFYDVTFGNTDDMQSKEKTVNFRFPSRLGILNKGYRFSGQERTSQILASNF